MSRLQLYTNALGFEIHDGGRLVTLYRATEELPREESPKPCFAPIYTPGGMLVTEYRPADHLWHTGLYFGWVHVNQANLWGGPWYLPEKNKYELEEHTHGVQQHAGFTRLEAVNSAVAVEERLVWLDADDSRMATEERAYRIQALDNPSAYAFDIRTRVRPSGGRLKMGASRAARYSGLELRLGPPFAEARHWDSEGRRGHEAIMGRPARWVAANGARGGAVAMMDHPGNIRHPVTWFTRKNLLGAGLLMQGDLELDGDDLLDLRYAFYAFAHPPQAEHVEALYTAFASS